MISFYFGTTFQVVPLENGGTNEDFDDVLEALISTGGK